MSYMVDLKVFVRLGQIFSLIFRKAGRGVWNINKDVIPVGTMLGPYRGTLLTPKEYAVAKESGYAWELMDSMEKKRVVAFVDPGIDPDPVQNWMAIINSACFKDEQNVVAVQYKLQIFYRVCKPIKANTELLTFYGDNYSHSIGIDPKAYREDKSYKTFWEGLNPDEIVECSICMAGFISHDIFLNHRDQC